MTQTAGRDSPPATERNRSKSPPQPGNSRLLKLILMAIILPITGLLWFSAYAAIDQWRGFCRMNELSAADEALTDLLVTLTIFSVVLGITVLAARMSIHLITQYRRQQEQLHQQKNFSESILRSQQDIVFVTDVHGVVRQISDVTESVLGYRRDEIIGKLASAFFPPDKREEMMELSLLSCLRDHEVLTDVEIILQVRSGEHIPVQFTGSPIKDAQGRVVAAIGVGRDLREYKRVQARIIRANTHLSAIIDSATGFYISTSDMDGIITSWNKGAELIMGYSADETIGKMHISQFCFTDDLEAGIFLRVLRQINETGDGEYEARFVRKSGDVFPVHLSTTLLKDQAGNLMGMLAIIQDITDRKRAESDLLDTKTQLEQVNRQLMASIEHANQLAQEATVANAAKSEFLANMSHEIRTPMNAIIGFSEHLTEQELTEEQLSYILLIRDSGKSLLALINGILDFSKIEAGKLDVDIIDCSLGNILDHVDSLLRSKATEKGLDFKVTIATKLPAQIRTDPTRVTQCLVNLANNAVKFTEKGHVHINVSLETDRDEPFIRFDVEDTGIGISDDKQESVFEAFAQAESSTTRHFGGTGLGLSITRKLIDILGGNISVQSEPGRGSVFSLLVPCGIDLDAVTLLDDLLSTKLEREDHNGHNKTYVGRVLVAEDNLANQILIKTTLKKKGLDPLLVENGRQALDAAKNDTYDLIFMDMHMPVMDGYKATQAIRNAGITTPVIALTANAMRNDEKKCIAHGCDAYLSKPFDKRILYDLMDKFLDSSDNIAATESNPQGECNKDFSMPSGEQSKTDVSSKQNQRQPSDSVIDWQTILDICDDEETVAEIAKAICCDLPKNMDHLLDAAREQDLEKLQFQAHRMKGATATIGAGAVSQLANRLERYCKDGNLDSALPLIDQTRKQADKLIDFLSQPDWMQIAKQQRPL